MPSDEKKGKVLRIVSEIVRGSALHPAPAQNPPSQGELDILQGFRHSLKQAINASGKDKYSIIAEMGLLMNDGKLEYSAPEKWTSKNESEGLPAEFLPAFCKATGTIEPLRFLAEAAGCTLIERPQK